MNRRTFLRRVTTGIVGAAVLAHVPASVIHAARLTEPAHDFAIKRMLEVYWAYYKEHQKLPVGMRVGSQMFELFESELTVCQRFVNNEPHPPLGRVLLFKCTAVYIGKRSGAYDCEAVGQFDYARNAA